MSTTTQHSLDLIAVGLGKAGGRIAGELARRGHSAVALHTSPRGVADQAHLAPDRVSLIGGERGIETGGDSRIGRAAVREDARHIQALVGTHSRAHDVVLVCAGLGGGTGSAVAELVASLDRGRNKIVVLAVLPSEADTAGRRQSALVAVQELTDAQLDGLILVDGQRLAERASDASILDMHGRLNERIVAPIETFDVMDSREDLRAIRALSRNQLLDVLTSGGLLSMGSTTVGDLAVDAVEDAVARILSDGDLALDGVDLAALSALEVIIEAPKSALASTPAHFVDALRKNLRAKSPGMHVDVAIYQQTSRQAGPVGVHAIASAAALPTRLSVLVEDTAHDLALSRDKARRPPRLELGRLEVGSSEPINLADRRPRAISDVAPKPVAHVPAAAPVSAPASAPASFGSSPSISEPPSGDAADRGPNGAVYERLVSRYKGSSDDELLRAIERRLEQDRRSEDFRVRILAVEAMAQIGAHVFDGSLFAATEDNSPEVRSIAERALAAAGATRRAFG